MSVPVRVAVAMSGGVDSSVAAALLTDQGFEVIGLMLRLWSPDSPDAAANRCCSPKDIADARAVAARLGIPFFVLDAQTPFRTAVVDSLIRGYANGATPNPCIACNREIRWGTLLQYALTMQARYLATGHYARLRHEGGRPVLLRAADRAKDQSYVLSALTPEQLAHALFPLGELSKTQVREIARQRALPVADRPESQDLCFLGGGDYRDFLRREVPDINRPGEIVDPQGNRLGSHLGLYNYTIGQRKGIGVPSREPLYVIEKDALRNRLVVGPKEALGRRRFSLACVNWIAGAPPAPEVDILVRVRYRAAEVPARLEWMGGGRVDVETAQSLSDITPGQQAVFYTGEVCLGGGVIVA